MNGGSRIAAAAALAVALGTGPAAAETVAGAARLIDGDTIEVSGRVVRLHGIDAPETGQTCQDAAGRGYDCGTRALDALARLIGGARVRCAGGSEDRYGRLIATCEAGGRELNRAMVRDGWAVAFRRYSEDYLADELDAYKDGRGLWQGRFERPDAERERRWAAAARAAPRGCPIKGNISKNGRIYHTPWSRHYDRTRIDTAKGERWFCSEAEAIAAGWRAPYR